MPLDFNEVRSQEILDFRAYVAIATKEVLESWDKLALRKTRIKLQLVDGFIESSIGFLEKITMKEFLHNK